MTRVQGFLQDPPVKLQPAELAVDVEGWLIQICGRALRLALWRCLLCRHSALCVLMGSQRISRALDGSYRSVPPVAALSHAQGQTESCGVPVEEAFTPAREDAKVE